MAATIDRPAAAQGYYGESPNVIVDYSVLDHIGQPQTLPRLLMPNVRAAARPPAVSMGGRNIAAPPIPTRRPAALAASVPMPDPYDRGREAADPRPIPLTETARSAAAPAMASRAPAAPPVREARPVPAAKPAPVQTRHVESRPPPVEAKPPSLDGKLASRVEPMAAVSSPRSAASEPETMPEPPKPVPSATPPEPTDGLATARTTASPAAPPPPAPPLPSTTASTTPGSGSGSGTGDGSLLTPPRRTVRDGRESRDGETRLAAIPMVTPGSAAETGTAAGSGRDSGGTGAREQLTTVVFAGGSGTLPEESKAGLKALADRMTQDPGLKVQLLGYAAGDDSQANKARRLSLSRVLAIREYLMDRQVASQRVEVRALGNRGRDSSDGQDGAPDRVDILVQAR